jgi:hypothetical protein
MIERIHGYAEQYYLPLESAAYSMISSLHAVLSESNPERRQHLMEMALYGLMRFLHVQREMTKATGGIIVLKDFDSEDQIAALRAKAISILPFDSLELALLSESSFNHLTEFLASVQSGDLSERFKAFSEWAENTKSVREFIRLISCHNSILQRNLGLVYKPWYGRAPPRLSSECEETAKKIQQDMQRNSNSS